MSIADTANNDFVTIKSCGSLLEADGFRARLDASEIECLIPDEQLMQTVAFNLNTYGYVRLQVRRNDAARALEILALDTDLADEIIPPKPEIPPHEVPLSSFKKVVSFMLPVVIGVGWIIFGFILYDYSWRGVTRKKKQWIIGFIAGSVFWFLALVFAL